MKTPLRLLFFFLSLFMATAHLSAQGAPIPGRYTADVFANVNKTPDILFGQNAVKKYSDGTNYPAQNLFLDFYEPVGDVATKRPLVILAFGGGFIQGGRGDLAALATAYAKKGYTVASIDYRIVTNATDQQMLGDPFVSDDMKKEIVRDVMVKAAADMKAAVRFFKHDAATANTYRIDTDNIFLGGASAGAITALQTAYVDNVSEDPNLAAAYAANGGLEGNTDLPGNSLLGTYNSRGIAGVINIAGGVLDTTIIDANEPPVYSAHGDQDEVIPFTSGVFKVTVPTFFGMFTVVVPITFYGSKAIETRANNINLKNVLYTIPNGAHETPGQPPHIENIVSASSVFMESEINATPLPVKLVSFTVRANQCHAVLDWHTALEEQSSHYDIETSADGVRFARTASVKSKNATNGAAYSYQLQGLTKAVWVRLKMVDIDGTAAYSKAQRFSPRCNGSISVQVYPNPAQHKATVTGLAAGQVVTVVTVDGRTIWSQRAAANTVAVPVGSFANGLLLVQVRDENGTVISSTKLMKN